MLLEADLILDKFPEFIGTPQENIDTYRKSSVFSHTDTTIGKANYFLNSSILFFHEPDIDWWLYERGATYYDMNSFDICLVENMLRDTGALAEISHDTFFHRPRQQPTTPSLRRAWWRYAIRQVRYAVGQRRTGQHGTLKLATMLRLK